MASTGKATTLAKADAWETTSPLLNAMFAEFKELSKKRSEGAVGASKIALVNRLLTKCREILQGEASLEFLDLIDSDMVPQTSDVVLMLSQYAAAMRAFRDTYYGWNGAEHAWSTAEKRNR